MVDWILLGIAILLIIVGILGCILPVIPGPPISFGGILILHYTRFGDFTFNQLVILGILAIGVTVLDYIVPIWGTKKLGGSKYGVWGAAIGLVIGLFFGPVGIILGPFLGALVGELIKENDSNRAFKAALGSFVGFLLGIGMKLAVSLVITWYFIAEFF